MLELCSHVASSIFSRSSDERCPRKLALTIVGREIDVYGAAAGI